MPEDGFRPVSEFDGKMLEAMFTEAGGGMGGGGDLELEAMPPEGRGRFPQLGRQLRRRRIGGRRSRRADPGDPLGHGIGVATGDFSADGLFDRG